MARCFHTLGVRIKQPTGPASRFLLTYLDSNRILPHDPPPPLYKSVQCGEKYSFSVMFINIYN